MSVTNAKKWHVWAALIGAPVVLGCAFIPFGAYLAQSRGLSGDALKSAMEPIAVYPGVIGFGAVLALTRWLAARDGLALTSLGWRRPAALELVVGLGVALAINALNAWLLHPLIRRADPTFDPSVPSASLGAVLIMLSVAVLAEDTLYRGYAFTILGERYGRAMALTVPTIFYALITPASWPLMLWAFGFGLVLASLRRWCDTLWPVMLTHFLVATGPKLVAAFDG